MQYCKKVTITLPVEAIKRLDAFSSKTYIKKSTLIKMLIMKYLKVGE